AGEDVGALVGRLLERDEVDGDDLVGRGELTHLLGLTGDDGTGDEVARHRQPLRLTGGGAGAGLGGDDVGGQRLHLRGGLLGIGRGAALLDDVERGRGVELDEGDDLTLRRGQRRADLRRRVERRERRWRVRVPGGGNGSEDRDGPEDEGTGCCGQRSAHRHSRFVVERPRRLRRGRTRYRGITVEGSADIRH